MAREDPDSQEMQAFVWDKTSCFASLFSLISKSFSILLASSVSWSQFFFEEKSICFKKEDALLSFFFFYTTCTHFFSLFSSDSRILNQDLRGIYWTLYIDKCMRDLRARTRRIRNTMNPLKCTLKRFAAVPSPYKTGFEKERWHRKSCTKRDRRWPEVSQDMFRETTLN